MKRDVAPSIERRPQEPERGALQHCSSWAPLERGSSLAIRAFGRVLLASYIEIASESARAPRLAPGPGEVVGLATPQRLVIVWDGDSGKTIRTGWCAQHRTPPATGAMHALDVCAHGAVIYI